MISLTPKRRKYIVGLRFMPLEHILEGLHGTEIAEALGVGVHTGKRIKDQPWCDGYEEARENGKWVDMDDAADQKIRQWLEGLCLAEKR